MIIKHYYVFKATLTITVVCSELASLTHSSFACVLVMLLSGI